MFGRRRLGEPWYTAIYKDPARLWWLPGLLTGVVLVAFRLMYGSAQVSDLLPGAPFGALLMALAYASYRSDTR
jgi:hypothetical protein